MTTAGTGMTKKWQDIKVHALRLSRQDLIELCMEDAANEEYRRWSEHHADKIIERFAVPPKPRGGGSAWSAWSAETDAAARRELGDAEPVTMASEFHGRPPIYPLEISKDVLSFADDADGTAERPPRLPVTAALRHHRPLVRVDDAHIAHFKCDCGFEGHLGGWFAHLTVEVAEMTEKAVTA